MKRIEAIIKQDKLDDIVKAIHSVGIHTWIETTSTRSFKNTWYMDASLSGYAYSCRQMSWACHYMARGDA